MTEQNPADTGRESIALPEVSATGDEVVGAAETLIGEKPEGDEQRTYERKSWVTPLTIWVQELRAGKPVFRVIEVVAHDISRGGFSFVYRQYLHPGTTIHTRFDALPEAPVVRAVVRNCVHLSGNLHRTGVQFMAR